MITLDKQENKKGRPKRRWTDGLLDRWKKDTCTFYRMEVDRTKWNQLVRFVVDTANGQRAHGVKERKKTNTLCLKKCVNFERPQLEIIRINFDDIWQKYSKYARIEFACFSFRAGLLFYQLFVFQTGHLK